MAEQLSSAILSCCNADCHATFPLTELVFLCPSCGDLLEVKYTWEGMIPETWKSLFQQRLCSLAPKDRSGVWRFRELLPFLADGAPIVTLGEGNTPVYEAPSSAKHAGLEQLYLKHLGINPTGSFKDYGVSAAITQVKSMGIGWVACASTGNTSASMAAYAAKAGIRSLVLVPADGVAMTKLSQALEYGALILQVEGSFDESLRLAYQIAKLKGICLLNSFNPFRIEGQKGIIFEILEFYGWDPPDWIVMPGGNLGNCAATGKALEELQQLGFIKRLPRLAVIQAENASPFYRLWKKKVRTRMQPVEADTLATAINIGNPVSWKKALKALSLTDGVCEQVSENDIATAKAVIGREGIGCEPASAATLAGVKKLVARGTISRDARIVGILTGHVLKDNEYTLLYHGDPEVMASTGRNRPFLRAGIKPRFANRPIRVGASRETIIKTLDEIYGES